MSLCTRMHFTTRSHTFSPTRLWHHVIGKRKFHFFPPRSEVRHDWILSFTGSSEQTLGGRSHDPHGLLCNHRGLNHTAGRFALLESTAPRPCCLPKAPHALLLFRDTKPSLSSTRARGERNKAKELQSHSLNQLGTSQLPHTKPD